MELRAKEIYRAPDFDILVGATTLDVVVELTDERKIQMLADFPEIFEEVPAAEVTKIKAKYAADSAQAAEMVKAAEEAKEKRIADEAAKRAEEEAKAQAETEKENKALESNDEVFAEEAQKKGRKGK